MHKHTDPASAAAELLKRRSIRNSLAEWARHKGFEPAPHHQLFIREIEAFLKSDDEVLLLFAPGIHCCREDDDLAKAIRHMEELKIRRLPVINKGKRMVGILSLGDVGHSAPGDLLSEYVKTVSAHHH